MMKSPKETLIEATRRYMSAIIKASRERSRVERERKAKAQDGCRNAEEPGS